MAVPGRGASLQLVNPTTLAPPHGYNHGMYASAPIRGMLFIAGQIGWRRDGRLVGDGFTAQFDQALANLLEVVREMGGGPESIGKLTIYVTDMVRYQAERREIGVAYRRRMGKHFPAMTLVEVRSLAEPGAKVEIDGMAVI